MNVIPESRAASAAVSAADPFLITGPACVSFSGGRTSAYMLWRILQAHGGALPDNVVVCFANTGREMPATLDFVRDCGAAWGVHIAWLEYTDIAPNFEIVSHNSASRAGEPFDMLLRKRSTLPNPVARFCTQELKIRVMKQYVLKAKGWDCWTNVVGLRADEMGRVGKATAPNRERWKVVCPLAEAGITKGHVLTFWRGQTFDLRLRGEWEGNCDGCFLKSRGALTRMLRDHPARMTWWAEKETEARARLGASASGARFSDDRDYLGMADTVARQGVLSFSVFDDRTSCEWSCTD